MRGLSCGASRHELIFADWENEAVRTFDTRSKILQKIEYGYFWNRNNPTNVLYSAELNSLFIVNYHPRVIRLFNPDDSFTILSFKRTQYGWDNREKLEIAATVKEQGMVNLRFLNDRTLFFGQLASKVIHVIHVEEDLSMEKLNKISLETQYNGFEAQLIEDEWRLAIAYANGSVSLYRVEVTKTLSYSLVLLSSDQLPGAHMVLFVNDTLLVTTRQLTTYDKIFSYSTIDGLLQDKLGIVPTTHSNIDSWCFMNDKLFTWNYASKNIELYSGSMKTVDSSDSSSMKTVDFSDSCTNI